MIGGHVYRCYDASGLLLYVGTTVNEPAARIVHHRYTFQTTGKCAWVEQLDRLEVDSYPDWREALVAEAALIAALSPEGNTQSRRAEWSHSPAIDGYRSLVLRDRNRQVAA